MTQKDPAPWIILKMARPLAEGDLWTYLEKLDTQKVILIISCDDLRKENMLISKGLSWERTASDIAYSLGSDGPFKHMRRLCRHIVVTIGHEGVFFIHDSNMQEQTQYRLFFHANYMEDEMARDKNKDVIGKHVAFTAGLTFGLLTNLEKMNREKSLSHIEQANHITPA